ncbi:MAG: UvrD-helicase domain-containing protein, partial [Candidatus Phytoplasma sp. TWB_XP]
MSVNGIKGYYIYKLSQEQLKIIQYNKSSLNILAGPGTGKITVLTELVKYLINKLNILSENILILSFNKSAVEEIEKRLLIENVKIMTFHGLSTSILKKNINLFNNKFNDNFEIIDDLKKENIIKHLLKSDNLFSTSAGFCEVKYGIYKVKNNINNLENIKNNYFYYKYCNYLKENNLIDFDDLNKYIYQLFLNEKYLLIDFQSKYKYILIDEIQDINFYQYQLIKLLSQKSILFIVGDLNQSIYSFRGSKNI